METNLILFALICTQNGALHSSNGNIADIEENDWFLDLSPEIKEKVRSFLVSAVLGEAKTFDGVTLLRIAEDKQLCCECCY